MNEIWRWSVPVPLNLPHRLTKDDVYQGKHIPAGSLVFGNIWAICRDPEMFPEPEEFKPERYWNCTDRRMDPRNYVFGFGRRVCPGEHLVESSVWMLLATMMATMRISKARDEMGEIVEPEVKFENSVFR
jgi:cytochrome P450